MKILVTGANGYLGQGVVKQLLDDGHDVIATDIACDGVDERAVKKACDLFSIEDPYNYFGKPEILVHMAWRDGFKHASLNHINDLPKHYKFLSDIMQDGLKKVCVMGSMHEIGFFEGSIDENTPANPQSLYGISKNALRNCVQLLSKERNIEYQWIRGFYIVGNTARGCSIFSKIVQAAEAGKKEFPFTMGLNQFDFINYDEFCYRMAAIVEQDEVLGVINCCSGRPMSLSDRVEKFIKENDFDIKLQYGAFPDRPYDSKAIWGNDIKLNKILENK